MPVETVLIPGRLIPSAARTLVLQSAGDYACAELSGSDTAACLRSIAIKTITRIIPAFVIYLVSSAVLAGEPQAKTVNDAIGTLSVPFPSLGDVQTFSEKSISPSTKEFRFQFKDGSGAVLISTRIRPDLPKDDRLLGRIEPKYRDLQQLFGAQNVSLEYVGKSPNRVLAVVVVNAVYGEFFPLIVQSETSSKDIKAVSVSEFVIVSGRLFECAIFVPNTRQEKRDDLVNRASRICEAWRAGIKVLPDKQ